MTLVDCISRPSGCQGFEIKLLESTVTKVLGDARLKSFGGKDEPHAKPPSLQGQSDEPENARYFKPSP